MVVMATAEIYLSPETDTGQLIPKSLDAFVIPYLVIHVVGVILNGAVFWVLVKNALFDSPSNRFLVSLSLSHLLSSSSTLVISATWLHGVLTEEGIFDAIYIHVLFSSSIFNTVMITCIAGERCITITRPMRYKSIVTSGRCSVAILSAWATSTCLALAPIINFDRTDPRAPEEDQVYFPLTLVAITSMAFLIMCSCYYVIFTIAKEKCHQIQIGRLSDVPYISSDWQSSANPSQTQVDIPASADPVKPIPLLQQLLIQASRHTRHLDLYRLKQMDSRSRQTLARTTPRKTVGTILALIGSLLLTQMPILSVYFDKDLWRLSLLMLSCSAITNPLLYGFLNRKIRTELWILLQLRYPGHIHCRCHHHGENQMYSEMIKDMVLKAAIPLQIPATTQMDNNSADSSPKDILQVEDGTEADSGPASRKLDRIADEDEIQVPKSPMPRKDSHDSGADLTFTDDEDEEESANPQGIRRSSIQVQIERLPYSLRQQDGPEHNRPTQQQLP